MVNKMSARLAIPAEDSKGLNARLSEHFGKALYFAVVELKENGKVSNLQVISKSEHFGGIGNPQKFL